MSDFYKNYLNSLSTLVVSDSDCAKYLQDNTLFDVFQKLVQASQEIADTRSMLTQIDSIFDALCRKALDNLTKQQNNIVAFYVNYFETHSVIGDETVYTSPDVIILLGCDKSILDERIQGTIPYCKQFPNIPVVLSGGGFFLDVSESEYMYQQMKTANIPNPILQESDSMDTLGNALFTKLILKAEKQYIIKNE